MASVDVPSLNAGLDSLVQEGIIMGWQKRPFGMYYIGLAFAEDLRPDTKETAMWVMGASYAAQMEHARMAIEELVGAEEVASIERHLAMLTTNNAIQGWVKDEDGDYIVRLCNGEVQGMRAKGMLLWTLGALCILFPNAEQQAAAEPDRAYISEALASLTAQGRIRGWRVDEDSDYVVQLLSGEELGRYAKDMLMWLDGALHVSN